MSSRHLFRDVKKLFLKKSMSIKSVNDTDNVLPMKMISIHEQEKNVIHGTALQL